MHFEQLFRLQMTAEDLSLAPLAYFPLPLSLDALSDSFFFGLNILVSYFRGGRRKENGQETRSSHSEREDFLVAVCSCLALGDCGCVFSPSRQCDNLFNECNGRYCNGVEWRLHHWLHQRRSLSAARYTSKHSKRCCALRTEACGQYEPLQHEPGVANDHHPLCVRNELAHLLGHLLLPTEGELYRHVRSAALRPLQARFVGPNARYFLPRRLQQHSAS